MHTNQQTALTLYSHKYQQIDNNSRVINYPHCDALTDLRGYLDTNNSFEYCSKQYAIEMGN